MTKTLFLVCVLATVCHAFPQSSQATDDDSQFTNIPKADWNNYKEIVIAAVHDTNPVCKFIEIESVQSRDIDGGTEWRYMAVFDHKGTKMLCKIIKSNSSKSKSSSQSVGCTSKGLNTNSVQTHSQSSYTYSSSNGL